MSSNNLIRIDPFHWPYSITMLRLDEPRRSISVDPSDEELAAYNCYRVNNTAPDIQDLANYKAVEVQPLLNGPPFFQRWEIIEMSPDEKEDYYRSTHPPRWLDFVNSLPAEVNNLLTSTLQSDIMTALKIPAGILEAKNGDSRLFLSSWQRLKDSEWINEELTNEIKDLAIAYDLPAEFVAGL